MCACDGNKKVWKVTHPYNVYANKILIAMKRKSRAVCTEKCKENLFIFTSNSIMNPLIFSLTVVLCIGKIRGGRETVFFRIV